MHEEYADLDAVDRANLVRSGDVAPLELVEAAIARIEALDTALNAVITPLYDRAREQAKSPALPDGPFRGVPMVLKDFICHSAGDPFLRGDELPEEAGLDRAPSTPTWRPSSAKPDSSPSRRRTPVNWA